MVLGETSVSVDATQFHSFADMRVSGPTLEALTTEDVRLARYNVSLAKVRHFLSGLDYLSGEFVAHYERRFDLVSD